MMNTDFEKGRNKKVFVGVIFLLIGLSILLRVFFNIHIPVFRTFFGVFIIYLGIKMLLGTSIGDFKSFGWHGNHEAVFSDEEFSPPLGDGASKRYHTVFGSSRVDLTGVNTKDADVDIEVNTVFGESKVFLNPGTPVKIAANSVFGEARMPDGNVVAFGTMKYLSDSAKQAPHSIRIHGNVVFGSLHFTEKSADKSSEDKD